VSVDGTPVQPEVRSVCIALNKPPGYVTSCRHAGKRIVLELVDVPQRIFPVAGSTRTPPACCCSPMTAGCTRSSRILL